MAATAPTTPPSSRSTPPNCSSDRGRLRLRERGQHVVTVEVELPRADARDPRQLAECDWMLLGDRHQGLVVEDDERRDLLRARDPGAPGPERVEPGLADRVEHRLARPALLRRTW